MCDCSDSITNGAPPVAATVGPNLTLSNLYAGNVFTNFINVSYLQINSVNGTAGQVLTATGTGSQIYWSTPSGGAGSSQWTTIGSVTPNPIYYSNSVGIGSTAVPTANLMVTGNIYASNSLTTTNVVSTSLVVSGAMTSNVSNTTLFYDTLTIPYVNTLQLTAPSIISQGGVSVFSNLIVSNLQVTNTLIITATNTQTTNSLSIINQGTATALYVNQNEFPNMTYNVAEFWDHTQLAMVIDGYGNVAVHTASSPGYAFTVVDGAKIDNLTVTGVLSASGAALSSLNASNITTGILSSSRIYGNTLGNISGSNVTTGINASNVTTGILSSSLIYGNTLGNISGSNVTTGINASNITTGILSSSLIYGNTLGNISGSNVTTGINASNITTGILSSALIYGNTLGNISGSNVTTGINASNITTGILSSSLIYGNTLGNISGSNVTTGINASNITTGILSSSLIYGNTLGNISGSNVTTGINASNITTGILSSTLIFANTLSNINSSNISQPFSNLAVSNSVTTTNIFATGTAYIIGNTGIGTKSPGYLLDVAGYMRAGAIVDSTSSIGSTNQILTETGSGLLWSSSAALDSLTVYGATFLNAGLTVSGGSLITADLQTDTLEVTNALSAARDSYLSSLLPSISGVTISGGTTLTWIIDSPAGQLYSWDGVILTGPSFDTGLLQVAALADDVNYYTIDSGTNKLNYGLPSSGILIDGGNPFIYVFVDKISGKVWAIDTSSFIGLVQGVNFVYKFNPSFATQPIQIATWGTDDMYILNSDNTLWDSHGNLLMINIIQVTADVYGNYYTIDTSHTPAVNGNIITLLNGDTYSSVTTQRGDVVFLSSSGTRLFYYTPVSVSANNFSTNSIIASRAKFQNLTLNSTEIALGSNAMMVPGNYDIAIGSGSMQYTKSASGYSVAIGAGALTSDEGLGYNTAIGAQAMQTYTGAGATGGGYNTAIGYQAGPSGPYGNTLSLGAGAQAGADYAAVFGPGMNVGIGTNVPDSSLQVIGLIHGDYFSGDGSSLTNLSGGAVSGTVGSALVVTQGAQAAITSVGTLTSLTSSGRVTAPFFIGGGNVLSNINASNLAFGVVPSSLIYGNTLSNINASNLAFGVVPSSLIYGNTLSNINAANLFGTMTTANIGTLNVTSISVSGSTPTSGYVLSTTGTGLAWIAGGGGGGSQWTGTAGSSIYYAPYVGIGSSAAPTANLMVTGNIYASNAIQTTNIVAAGFTSNSTNTNFNYDTLTVPYLNVTSTLSVSGLSVSGQISAIGNTVSASYGVCPPLTARQGVAASTNWNPSGGTQGNFFLNSGVVSMQAGSNTMAASPTTITFPIAYVNNPIVLLTPYSTTAASTPWVSAITTTNFQVTWAAVGTFEWISIGI